MPTLYKVISSCNQSKDGGSFDWTDYLPNNDGPGKWTPIVDVKECESGYHVTEFWNMWFSKECKIYEVETAEEYVQCEVGVTEKRAFSSIRLICEFNPCFANSYCNTGNYNTGGCNTGHYNTGDLNTGNGKNQRNDRRKRSATRLHSTGKRRLYLRRVRLARF